MTGGFLKSTIDNTTQSGNTGTLLDERITCIGLATWHKLVEFTESYICEFWLFEIQSHKLGLRIRKFNIKDDLYLVFYADMIGSLIKYLLT